MSGLTRVFLLEDNALIRRYLCDLLEHVAGYEVQAFDQPQALYDQCRRLQPDLLLLDIGLPNAELDGRPVDGIMVCKKMKDDFGTAMPPVVILTAHALAGEGPRILAESCADLYEAKPILDEDAFLARLASLLSN
jgi:two-component system, cell cycle response regulator DivK